MAAEEPPEGIHSLSGAVEPGKNQESEQHGAARLLESEDNPLEAALRDGGWLRDGHPGDAQQPVLQAEAGSARLVASGDLLLDRTDRTPGPRTSGTFAGPSGLALVGRWRFRADR